MSNKKLVTKWKLPIASIEKDKKKWKREKLWLTECHISLLFIRSTMMLFLGLTFFLLVVSLNSRRRLTITFSHEPADEETQNKYLIFNSSNFFSIVWIDWDQMSQWFLRDIIIWIKLFSCVHSMKIFSIAKREIALKARYRWIDSIT